MFDLQKYLWKKATIIYYFALQNLLECLKSRQIMDKKDLIISRILYSSNFKTLFTGGKKLSDIYLGHNRFRPNKRHRNLSKERYWISLRLPPTYFFWRGYLFILYVYVYFFFSLTIPLLPKFILYKQICWCGGNNTTFFIKVVINS